MVALPIFQLFGVDVVTFSIDLAAFFGVYLIISLSLNLELGYTGIPNFGKLLFVAGGSTIAASISTRLAAYILGINTGGDFIAVANPSVALRANQTLMSDPWLSMGLLGVMLIVGSGAGAAFGFLSSFPAIRLRDDYLSMLLLAAAQFFVIFITAYPPLIGGSQNMIALDPFNWGGSERGTRTLIATTFILAAAGLFYLYSERLARSPLGRMLRAIRDNEVASEAVGKDNVAARRRVLIVASAMCGIAGALFGAYLSAQTPTLWTRFDWTIVPWVMVIIGGAGNNLGAALGTLAVIGIVRITNEATTLAGSLSLPVGVVQTAGGLVVQYMPLDTTRVEYLATGAALILILMFRPEGLLGEKSTFTMSKKRLRHLVEEDGGEPQKGEEKH